MRDIDVITPSFNSLPYLKEAIASIRRQTLAPANIIVVDDGSSDGTSEWLATQSDIVAHRQNHAGSGAARNHAIRLSNAPILAFLDADDLWMPEFLEQQLTLLSVSPETEAAFCRVRQFDDRSGAEEIRAGQITSAMMIVREAFDRVGPFPEDRGVADFFHWFLTARNVDLRVAMNDAVLLARRIHEANSGREKDAQRRYLHSLKEALASRRRAS